MAASSYHPLLVSALRETLVKLQTAEPHNPAFDELEKNILRMLAEIDASETAAPEPGAYVIQFFPFCEVQDGTITQS
jgi:hypothetical protein